MDIRTDLNGLRYKVDPDAGPIYLIMDGKRRWISDLGTWESVWNGAEWLCDPEIGKVEEGDPIPPGTMLLKGDDSDLISLWEPIDKILRPISSPEVMERYGMSGGHRYEIPQVVVDGIFASGLRQITLVKDWTDDVPD